MTLLSLKVYIDQVEDVETLSRLVDETALRLYEVKIRTSGRRLRMVLGNVEMVFWGQELDTGEIYRAANWFEYSISKLRMAEHLGCIGVYSSSERSSMGAC